MPPKYKIFYTDDTSLLWSDIAPNGDPALIPDGNTVGAGPSKRIGVHSIIQAIDSGQVREVIEQYHYVFSTRDQMWIGVGLDGLLDLIATDFDDIRCIMHGRTMATERFWQIKQNARTDPDIIGGVSAETAERTAYYAFNKYRDPYWQNGPFGAYSDNYDWADWARHRQYDERYAEKPVYGLQDFYH
jgi:hypothetical protein